MMSKEPKGKLGNLQTVCSHYTYEGNVHLNKALNEICLCTHVKPCQVCPKDSGIPENTRKKKRKKKAISELWVCLTCRGQFCGSGHNHMRAHCGETEHWWGAKNNDPTSVYCFKCRREVMVWSPKDDKKVARIDLRFFIAGLKTLGRQSSFNAILQNLLSLYPLRKEILEAEFPRTARIAIALRELFVKTSKTMRQSLYGKTGATVRTKSDEDVNTSTLLSHMYQIDPDFRSRDSEETFSCILRALHEDVKKAWAGAHEIVNSTLVDSVFRGKCSITASCSECSDSSTEEERFFHLSLLFAQSIASEYHVSVEECLRLYTDPQLWICKKCIEAGYEKDRHVDDKRAGTRRIWISEPPQVLVIHLKRKESDDHSKKLKIRINPQDKLNIRPFMDPSCGTGNNITYRLVGVVQYDEKSGHYANVKALSYKTVVPDWFKAVDLQVNETALKSVEGEPHLLFYRRVIDKGSPLQPEKLDKVINEGGVVKKGKEPAMLEQIGDKIPPLAEGSHPMESPEGLPNLPQLIEESRPIENLPLPVEGSPPRENLPVPFQGADPIEIRANVIMPLPNLGNTCYVNVVLQNLLSLDSLRSKMLGPNVPTGPLISSLKDLFIQTSPLCHAPVPLDPENLLESMFELCPQLKRGREEDSHEFLSFFLDQLEMEEEVKAQKPMDIDTIVNSLFRGSVSTTVSSMQCHHDSTTPAEKFLGMQLYVPKGSLIVSIEDLWASYTAERKILVVKAPPVLVITIHNYEFISSTETKKLEVNVDFKEMFDIRPFMKQGSVAINTLYQLTGVVQHTGDPAGQAHYTAYVRANKMGGPKQHSETKYWFCASDSHIQEVSLDEVLGCEPYMLFYERCDADLTCEGSNLAINMQSQFSANPSGEEYSNMQPPTSTSVSGSSPAPQDGVRPWEYPKTRNLSKKKRHELDQVNDIVGQEVGKFLDRHILQGDTKPFYHYELVTMCERGAGSRKLNVHYSDLLHFSKDLAMDVCNGYRRLMFSLKEAAINFARKIAGLAADGHLVLSDNARKRLEQLGSMDDMNSSLELRFIEMPKLHELLKHHLSGPLTQKMHVYGNYEKAIRTPLPVKCSLLQRLLADVISGHRVGLSWNGEFTLNDIELMDDRVFIAKEPKPFSIHPVISPEMVRAMGRDFFGIANLVLQRFRYPTDAVLGNFRTTGAYIPYLETFYDMLTQMDKYAEWWSSNDTAEAMRHLIEHNPFLKPVLARSNLWSGIFSANRSHDRGDRSVLFKVILETHDSSNRWFHRLYYGGNRMIQCVVEHKDNSLVGTDPAATVLAAAEAVTTSSEAVPPAAAAETVPTPTEAAPPRAAETVTLPAPVAETVPTPSEAVKTPTEPAPPPAAETVTLPAPAADPSGALRFSYYKTSDEFLFEVMRHLAHHGSAHSFLRCGRGPRLQLMESLEEPELAAVHFVEEQLVQALAELLKNSAMTGLLKAVWECYKNCNHPRQP